MNESACVGAWLVGSRSTAWFEEVMRDTKGRGVDVVLNSLAGRYVHRAA